MRGVLDHPRVAALQNDADFWRRVDPGDLDGALALPSARALVADPALRGQLAQLGLVEPEEAASAEAFDRALRTATSSWIVNGGSCVRFFGSSWRKNCCADCGPWESITTVLGQATYSFAGWAQHVFLKYHYLPVMFSSGAMNHNVINR